MPVALNHARMLVGVRAICSALDVHSHNACFSTSLCLFLIDHASLSFMKAFLNDAKQATSKS